MSNRPFILLVLTLLPSVLTGQPPFDSRNKSFSKSPGFFLLGVSVGQSPMYDTKYSQWLSSNGHDRESVNYMSFRISALAQEQSKMALGVDFEFCGTTATTNYPLRFNMGFTSGYAYSWKSLSVILTGTLGYSISKVNTFQGTIPIQLSGVTNSDQIQLNKRGLYFNPSLKILFNVKQTAFCTGIEIGARAYFFESRWHYKYAPYSNQRNMTNQVVYGIPDLTAFDFYINISIGALLMDKY